jgi:purine nucleosidase/pyrimidine-specific ribonucleoside hydrolase
MVQPSKLLRVVLIIVGVFAIALGFTIWSWYFTTSRLNSSAQSFGIFSSPTEAMMTEIRDSWVGIQEAWIRDAGPETALGGGPHVWFVTACVWAESRADGSPVGSPTHDFDFPGGYYLETKDGWVSMSEESALFVGFWMRIFGMAGDGGGQMIHEPPSRPVCVRKAGVPTGTSELTSPPRKMLLIYDDDGSRDGMAALLYLLSHPDISIEAITISYGEAHPKLYIQHLGHVLDSFGIKDIPLGAGQDMPLAGGTPFPDWLRQLSDNFWDYPLPDTDKTYPFQNAPGLMVSIINQAPEPVTIFVSGPFTNLAQALQLDPAIKGNISAVYFMGGAVYVPGNITGLIRDSNNRVADWNIIADPQAAKEVFESGLELYMVPLDATNKVLLSQEDILPWRQGDDKANMVVDLYDIMFNTWGLKTAEIFDLTAAVLMVQSESCNFQPLHLDVITDNGPTLGQTIVVPNTEPNIHVCLEPNANQVKQNLNETFSP